MIIKLNRSILSLFGRCLLCEKKTDRTYLIYQSEIKRTPKLFKLLKENNKISNTRFGTEYLLVFCCCGGADKLLIKFEKLEKWL